MFRGIWKMEILQVQTFMSYFQKSDVRFERYIAFEPYILFF